MTTDDESGLSQLAALKQSIEDVLKENEALLGTAKTDIDKAGYRGKIIAYMYVLWLVEAASEKYRQSRKSLRERVEASPYQGEASEFPPSAKVIGVRAVLELLDMDAKSPEEAKPEEDSK